MRITIDVTDGSTTVTRETAGQPDAQQAAASDAGPPPEELLFVLGAKTGAEAGQAPGGTGVADAGKPPDWLVSAIESR
jgi:hypothetical protein